MSYILESLRHRPAGLWQLDGDSPFTDHSGYNRAGSSSVQPAKGISLSNGAVYSSILHRDCVGSFESPVFKQGSEDQSFSIGANVRTVKNTTGYTAQPYRENLILNPGPATNVANWAGISTDNGALTLITDTGAPSPISKAVRKTASSTGSVGLGAMTGTVQPGTYTASFWVRCSVATTFIIFLEGTATKVPYSKTGTALVANQWQRQTFAFDVTVAGTVKVGGYIPAQPLGTTLDMCSVMLEAGSVVNPYFCGSMAGFEWSGIPNASISRTRIDVSLVNPATSSTPSALGPGATVTHGISAQGKTWDRVATTTGGSGSRTYVPLADLLQEQEYVASYLIYNDGLTDVNVGIDWSDVGNNSDNVIPAGQTRRIYSNPGHRTYNNTFHFVDLAVTPANTSVLVSEPTVYPTGVTAPFFDGDRAGAGWAGAPDASSSLMYISDGEQQILGNAGTYDGLLIDGTKVSFVTKYLNTGEARAEYDIQVPRAVNLFGIHTADKNSLYVDGELVAESAISEEQRADIYISTDSNLYTGPSQTGNYLETNSVVVYPRALSGAEVGTLAQWSKKFNDNASYQYGGQVISLVTDPNIVFANKTWIEEQDWRSGIFDGTTTEDDMLTPSFDSSGVSIAGTWMDSFAMDTGTTSIYGVYFDWDGEGVVVEASVDGTIWDEVVRGEKIASIPEGFDPTNEALQIRVSFAGGIEDDQSYLGYLKVVGLETGLVQRPNQRPVTITGGTPRLEKNALDLDDMWGVNLNGGTLTIGADPSDTPDLVKTIELWIKRNGDDPATLSNNFSNAYHFYSNGSEGSAYPRDQWVVRHFVSDFPDGFSGDFTISGDVSVGRIVFYPTNFDAAGIANIYNSYVGANSVRTDDNSVITVTESPNATDIYARDWAINVAG